MKYSLTIFCLNLFTQGALAASPSFGLYAKDQNDQVWTDGKISLHAEPNQDQNLLGYALLKSRASAALDAALGTSYSIAPLAQSSELNYYAVPIKDRQQLERLAHLAHESTGLCGSLELVSPKAFLKTEISILPAIYQGAISFEELKPLIEQIQLSSIDRAIASITALPSRYYRHPIGELAHQSIRQLWEQQLRTSRWSISEVSQSLSAQKSLVARLEGKKHPEETVIIGAHLDSIVSRSGDSKSINSAGADDDASGLAAVTELLRVIEDSGLSFDRSIELHAYAGEEVGLLGSNAIAQSYAAAGRKIAGMLQIDMAYYSQGESRGLIFLTDDYTSRDLRRLSIDLLRNYLGPVYRFGSIPKGSASDHKAFWNVGYPTVFPFEDSANFNPHIHSSSDTREQFDDGLLMRRVSQLALLFLAYQGGLESLAGAYEAQKNQILPAASYGSIKLAVTQQDDAYYLAIATPAAASTLELCRIEDEKLPHCHVERGFLEEQTDRGQTKVFYSRNAWPLANGQKWRVLAYDANDSLLAWRQFSLASP